jgi:hypothetical protein
MDKKDIEIDRLNSINTSLRKEIDINKDIINKAKEVLYFLPLEKTPRFLIKNLDVDFSKKTIKILQILHELSFSDSAIKHGDKELAILKDDDFLYFLEKTLILLPDLLELYDSTQKTFGLINKKDELLKVVENNYNVNLIQSKEFTDINY